MSKASLRARVWVDGRDEPIIADIMNPGGWFGRVHVVQIAIANALNPMYVIEADSEQSAIDFWADSDKYSNLIDDKEAQEAWENWIEHNTPDDPDNPEPETCTAGNDSHCVNLDNVGFVKFRKVEYFVEIPDHTDWSVVSAIADALEDDDD